MACYHASNNQGVNAGVRVESIISTVSLSQKANCQHPSQSAAPHRAPAARLFDASLPVSANASGVVVDFARQDSRERLLKLVVGSGSSSLVVFVHPPIHHRIR